MISDFLNRVYITPSSTIRLLYVFELVDYIVWISLEGRESYTLLYSP